MSKTVVSTVSTLRLQLNHRFIALPHRFVRCCSLSRLDTWQLMHCTNRLTLKRLIIRKNETFRLSPPGLVLVPWLCQGMHCPRGWPRFGLRAESEHLVWRQAELGLCDKGQFDCFLTIRFIGFLFLQSVGLKTQKRNTAHTSIHSSFSMR